MIGKSSVIKAFLSLNRVGKLKIRGCHVASIPWPRPLYNLNIDYHSRRGLSSLPEIASPILKESEYINTTTSNTDYNDIARRIECIIEDYNYLLFDKKGGKLSSEVVLDMDRNINKLLKEILNKDPNRIIGSARVLHPSMKDKAYFNYTKHLFNLAKLIIQIYGRLKDITLVHYSTSINRIFNNIDYERCNAKSMLGLISNSTTDLIESPQYVIHGIIPVYILETSIDSPEFDIACVDMLENLGVCYEMFASIKELSLNSIPLTENDSPIYRHAVQSLANTTLLTFRVLERARTLPVELYKPIWTNIIEITMISTYSILKHLYQNIISSLADPETKLLSGSDINDIFRCMKITHVQSNDLIELLCTHVVEDKYIKPIDIAALNQSIMILKPTPKLLTMIKEYRASATSALFLIPDKYDTKKGLEQKTLSSKNIISKLKDLKLKLKQDRSKIEVSDLLDALMFFSNESENVKHKGIVESVENRILYDEIEFLPDDAARCLIWYSHARRIKPGKTFVLDILQFNVLCMTDILELITDALSRGDSKVFKNTHILAAYAHLNIKPPFIKKLIDGCVSLITSGKQISQNSFFFNSSRILWSLTILEELTEEIFLTIESLLLPHLNKYIIIRDDDVKLTEGISLPLINQLTFGLMEVRINSTLYMTPSSRKISPLNQKRSYERAMEIYHEKTQQISSFTHKIISNLLREQGIYHECEKVIFGLYQVDIFIPPRSKNKSMLGIIIELDGVFHYDTYGFNEVGTSKTKKRHLTALGYDVINVSLLGINYRTSKLEKKKLIERIVEKIYAIEARERAHSTDLL